jgi:outer membrane protein assembly factor BamB
MKDKAIGKRLACALVMALITAAFCACWYLYSGERQIITPLWSVSLDSKVKYLLSTPVEGSAIALSASGTLYVISTTDGRTIARFGTRGVLHKPCVVGDSVIVATADCKLFSLSISKTLKENWPEPVDCAVRSDIVRAGDNVIFGAGDNILAMLDAKNGDVKWIFKKDADFISRPLVDGGSVIAATARGTVYRIDLVSGKAIWRFDSGIDGELLTVRAGDAMVFSDRKGKLLAIDPDTTKPLWSNENVGAESFAALADRVFFVRSSRLMGKNSAGASGAASQATAHRKSTAGEGSSDDNGLFCIDARSDKSIFEFKSARDIYGRLLAFSPPTAFVSIFPRDIAAIDTERNRIVGRFRTPAFVEGEIVFDGNSILLAACGSEIEAFPIK